MELSYRGKYQEGSVREDRCYIIFLKSKSFALGHQNVEIISFIQTEFALINIFDSGLCEVLHFPLADYREWSSNLLSFCKGGLS